MGANRVRIIPAGIYQLTDAQVGEASIIFCMPESFLFNQAREHGYIDDGFLSGGTEDCMRKLLLSLRGDLPVKVSFILTEEEGRRF